MHALDRRARAGVGTAALLAATAALGAVPGIYAGGSRPGDHQMDISIQVLRGGHRANWRVDLEGPCDAAHCLRSIPCETSGWLPSATRAALSLLCAAR
jgi:hypothetical protein